MSTKPIPAQRVLRSMACAAPATALLLLGMQLGLPLWTALVFGVAGSLFSTWLSKLSLKKVMAIDGLLSVPLCAMATLLHIQLSSADTSAPPRQPDLPRRSSASRDIVLGERGMDLEGERKMEFERDREMALREHEREVEELQRMLAREPGTRRIKKKTKNDRKSNDIVVLETPDDILVVETPYSRWEEPCHDSTHGDPRKCPLEAPVSTIDRQELESAGYAKPDKLEDQGDLKEPDAGLNQSSLPKKLGPAKPLNTPRIPSRKGPLDLSPPPHLAR